MAKTKDTSEDITPATTEAAPAVPAGGGSIPASAFDADLAAAKAAQDADAERAKAYEVPRENMPEEGREAMEQADQVREEEQAEADAQREAAEAETAKTADQTTGAEG